MRDEALVLFPQDLQEVQESHLGGKASNLLRLARAGFSVPRWFAVSTAAHKMAVASGDPAAGSLPDPLRALLLEAFEGAFLQDEAYVPVAVRSSAVGEDGVASSFAGQLRTFLHVHGPEGFLEALVGCWASGRGVGLEAYRQVQGLQTDEIAVAVIVQEMVEAESSGVAFTANPITGDRQEVVVRAAYGLGEGVVADQVETDGYVIRGDSVVADVTTKTERVVRDPSGAPGTVVAAVPAALRDRPVLTDAQALELARTARAIEAAFGAPQDIEWAFAGGRLHILQTRPITTLGQAGAGGAGRNLLGDRPTIWDNSNITESYSGVTSALTFSFASNAYQIVYQQVCELLGVEPATIAANGTAFRNMLGLLKGRVYYNLKNWYKLVSLLPGFEANKAFMEQMMGVKDPTPLSKEETRAGFVDRFGPLAYVAWRVLRSFLALDRMVSDFTRRFYSTYDVQRQRDLAAMSPHEIVDMYDLLEREVLRNWKAPIVTDIFAMVFYGILRKLCTAWCASAGDSLQNDLLCGEGGIESTEPTKALMRMALHIKGDPALLREFQVRPAGELAVWLLESSDRAAAAPPGAAMTPPSGAAATAPPVPGTATPPVAGTSASRGASGSMVEDPARAELASEMRQFLDRYGFRCMNELKLEEPSLRDDPTFAFVTLQNYLRLDDLDVEAMEAKEREIRQRAEGAAARALGFNPIKRAVFGWVLANARKNVKNRENLRFARTKIFGLCREMFNALGDKFAGAGLLDSPRDIYHLTVPEILGFIEGRAVCTDLRALAALRAGEFDRYRQEDIPDRFTTAGVAYLDAMADDTAAAATDADPNVLVGTSCCPGRVAGPVRVILSPKDDMRLDGEILVAERTDPGWVPLYPSAGGLLIERGSILSHSAIVARELGIPAIVGIRHLTRRVRDGQHVDMDARAGRVYLDPEGASAPQAPQVADVRA